MNEALNDLLAALEPVVEAFSRLGVAYYMGGSAMRFPNGNGATCLAC